jgi:hypothetical protein
MTGQKSGISMDQSIEYKIEIQGRLEDRWSGWFDDMNISVRSETGEPTVTVLSGLVTDQAALHGLLNRIRDLSIPLLSVQLMNSD